MRPVSRIPEEGRSPMAKNSAIDTTEKRLSRANEPNSCGDGAMSTF